MTSNTDYFRSLGPNYGYIEDLYRTYKQNPDLVNPEWRDYFDSIKIQANGRSMSSTFDSRLQESVFRLVNAYRARGHLHADINPLSEGIVETPKIDYLDPAYYNFTSQQLSQVVHCYHFQNREEIVLRELIAELQSVYCSKIGFEFEHIVNPDERYWLRERIENRFADYHADSNKRINSLNKLIDAEVFESQLHKRYIGKKWFSLKGGESLIPMIVTIIEEAGELDTKEVVMGMAHRGRLNILRNILNQPFSQIFDEFEDNNIASVLGSGDVKYHIGFDSYFNFGEGKRVKLHLMPNPSHLEFVYPVVEGICRAKQDLNYNEDRNAVLPLVLHGDAAFIGQGVVTETMNFSQVNGFNTGGTIHVVINNQIGFTTAPDEGRSTTYCTAFAKAIGSPVLHINSEDVDACCWAARFAHQYRNTFGKDIFLDFYCYRGFGHNEGDDPSYTNPMLYKGIKAKKPISSIYSQTLISEGHISEQDIKEREQSVADEFRKEQESLRQPAVMGEACSMVGKLRPHAVDTKVSRKKLKEALDMSYSFDDSFNVHPKLQKILEKRKDCLKKGNVIDWGAAEYLAFSTLLQDKVNIRLTGQDSGRGTFSHRHILLKDYDTGNEKLSTKEISEKYGSKIEVYNSTLSESGVLGFEFGYSTEARNSLVIWEAQFGDFANGAQVIIDQFISSSEQKWEQLSGIALFLPHGFEGQGPEHSSARLERFLKLCADGNMEVCYPTSASQCFHMIRRHALSQIKRPLVVMTPKSLLRAQEACSETADLTDGSFQTILVNDFELTKTRRNTQLILTTGKIYYDIERKLKEMRKPNVRVIRVEQLYPFPQFEIKKAIRDLKIEECFWVQEEPLNMGAWLYIQPYIEEKLNLDIEYIGRDLSASPATGSSTRHAIEQEDIVLDLIEAIE